MKKLTLVVLGILIGLALPFLVDYAMFGKFQPCKTEVVYEDGSSIQNCSSKQ